ncbi:MAG: DUF3048 domain-containing protein [Oscillospiraceae bacterium]|nr:DUF3048 domain-containing protein [Oscillospiraceae bacterium]
MKRSLFKSIVLVILCLAVLFTSVSCSKLAQDKLADENISNNEPETTPEPPVDQNSEPEKEEIPEPEPEPEPLPEIEKVVYYNPLTGEEVSEDISMKRPLAVMINNYPSSMPQLGIAEADIIYEMIVEGGLTRMCAVFQDIDEGTVLGSIRSSRHNYLDIVKAYDALYIHAGGSPQAYSNIESRDIDNICGVKTHGSLFYRDSSRLATMDFEHTLCIKAETALDYFANKSGYRLEHDESYKCNMEFTDNVALVNAQPATDIGVKFGLGKTSSFTYNADSENYTMYQHGGKEYYDGNMDQSVEFKNIIVIQTSVVSIDSKDRKEITLTGTGNGWFICNGEIAEITWSRSDNDAQFEYTYSDGTPLVYGVGKTYVCVIAKAGSVEFE